MIKELRKVIKTQLETIANSGKTYYHRAEKGAIYPHKVFNIESIDTNNAPRHDFIITIDVWTKSANAADDIADAVNAVFDNANLPNADILPTFYLVSCKPIDDEDESIERRQIKVTCQNYKNA